MRREFSRDVVLVFALTLAVSVASGCRGRDGLPGQAGQDGTCVCSPTDPICPTSEPTPEPTPPPPTPECVQTERPGDECAWNESACQWECFPPPVPPVEGICHVSNKGKDGNWNLQVSYKQSGEGHVKHLDPAAFCPPDFRSTPDQCTVARAYEVLEESGCAR